VIFENSIFLIELKNKGTGGWLSKAIDQLRNTIRLLKLHDNLDRFQYKKAYACNRKHPNFQVMDSEANRKFYRETGFRIDAQAKIDIK